MICKGVVVEFNYISGKGYIRPDGVNAKISFTHDSIRCDGYRSLDEGEEVFFISESSTGDSKAIEVWLRPL
jgi:cold shock CspA family protein